MMTLENHQPIIKKNWVKRTLTATVLIAYMVITIYVGVPLILFSTLVIQVKCFHEIITIAYNYKKLPEIPLFRTLNWYFLFVANYFFCGEAFAQYLEAFIVKYNLLGAIFRYHRFLSFCWFIIGIIWFLNLLRRKIIRQQFSVLAWTHFLCIIIVLQSYMIIQNLFEGLIWVFLPLSLVFLNDTFAYIFGRMYGRTPLIEVSPRKTLEGFLGGGLGSLVFGTVIAWALCHVDYMVCPTKYFVVEDSVRTTIKCNRTYLFQPTTLYDVEGLFSIRWYPFMFHVTILALFASFIAPFGGFCASGFKRAFKMKDFGDTIPGHGGVMDRFDCQYLMATFVNVYIISFVRNLGVERILARVLYLDEDSQVEFYHLLEGSLRTQELLEEVL